MSIRLVVVFNCRMLLASGPSDLGCRKSFIFSIKKVRVIWIIQYFIRNRFYMCFRYFYLSSTRILIIWPLVVLAWWKLNWMALPFIANLIIRPIIFYKLLSSIGILLLYHIRITLINLPIIIKPAWTLFLNLSIKWLFFIQFLILNLIFCNWWLSII